MERPRPGRTALWITVSPVPGKYAETRSCKAIVITFATQKSPQTRSL